MVRVNLEILPGPYQPALASGVHVESCRLLADIAVRTSTGWTAFRPAILHTGAPVTLLRRRVWKTAEALPISRVRIGGLNRRPECMFDATIALINLSIRDRFSQIEPIKAHALLADSDDVPSLLGMRGVLTDLRLHSNVAKSEAYIKSL